MVNASSAEMVADRGVTISSVGAPAVTLMVWVPHTRPKHEVMVVGPVVVGVNRPLLPMFPVEEDHDIGGD